MIPVLITSTAIVATLWLMALLSPWVATIWLFWLIIGLIWFINGLGRKGSPGSWYDIILMAPVLPYAWIFGVIAHFLRWMKENT